MAKFELKFFDCADSSTILVKKLENRDIIGIYLYDCLIDNEIEDYENSCIHLDKSTAIKFSKALRTEINKITESEKGGLNG